MIQSRTVPSELGRHLTTERGGRSLHGRIHGLLAHTAGTAISAEAGIVGLVVFIHDNSSDHAVTDEVHEEVSGRHAELRGLLAGASAGRGGGVHDGAMSARLAASQLTPQMFERGLGRLAERLALASSGHTAGVLAVTVLIDAVPGDVGLTGVDVRVAIVAVATIGHEARGQGGRSDLNRGVVALAVTIGIREHVAGERRSGNGQGEEQSDRKGGTHGNSLVGRMAGIPPWGCRDLGLGGVGVLSQTAKWRSSGRCRTPASCETV